MAFVYVQEGGSSAELYLHAHDTLEEAQKGAQSCIEATYAVSEIVEVPDVFVNTPENFEALQQVMRASLTLST